MNSIYLINDPKSHITRVCSYFCDLTYQRCVFNIPTKNLNLEQNRVTGIKFVEFPRADGK